MSGMNGISAYQQTVSGTWEMKNMGSDRVGDTTSSKAASAASAKTDQTSKVETKGWSPISAGSSLIPSKTEYGFTIGDVKLSDKAADYLKSLKAKFHNMEFITVSGDMKSQVQKNASAYGNANKMVVLIDEEKLERMATDESFRKKYEGIIAMSQNKLAQAKNSLAGSGADIKNFGMSVDKDGKESFFATVGKSQKLQKQRIEKKAAEKKAQKAKEQKKAEKDAREERIRKSRDKKAEKSDKDEDTDGIEETDDKDYVTFEAGSLDELFSKVSAYGYENASMRVMTDTEKMLGTQVDFKG